MTHEKGLPLNSFRRILCPTDFGSCAQVALHQALRLAEAYDARVDLLLEARSLLEPELIIRARDRDERLRVELCEVRLANLYAIRHA